MSIVWYNRFTPYTPNNRELEDINEVIIRVNNGSNTKFISISLARLRDNLSKPEVSGN